MFDGISTNAGVGGGVARTGADDQLGRVLRNELVEGDLVIPEDMDGGPLKHQILVDVPGEGVIIVDEDQV